MASMDHALTFLALTRQVLQQQESERRERNELLSVQEACTQHKEEVNRLQETLQTVRENTDRQCKEMQVS